MNAVFQTHVDGTNRVASIICVGASLLFLLPLIGRLLWHLSPSGDAAPAAAVLVAVPAVLAVVALRDDKHPVTGQYTARARTRVAWAGILSFVGGAILATQFHDPPSWLAEHGYGWRTLAWAVITLTLVGLAIITVAKRDRG